VGLLQYLTKVDFSLETIQKRLEKAMLTAQDFQDLITKIDVETDRIAVTVADLLAKLKDGGLTAEEEQAVFDAASAELEKLKGVGKDVPPATPPTP
jgi:hypothetical protein